MATQTIEFRSPPSQTITAKLFAVGSDTQVDSVSTTEATNRKGTYAAAYTNVPAGEYELIALVSTTPVARWFVTLTLTTATFQVYDKSQTVLMVADVVNASALAADAVAEIQSGLSTLTQTQVTGGAYAINNASFAFNTGLDFTTTQKAATLARVTLNDTTTTNTDMRGTDNAALAATALSTTQWTNTLATNIGTTNTTVAANLDATVSSRLASASYTAPSNLTAAQIATGVWQDATAGDFTTASSVGKSLYNAFTAGTSVFTVAALANAPSGGGGSATLANQTLIISTLAAIKGAGWDGSTDTLEKIRDAITAYISSAVGSVQSSAGTIVGFPSTLTIGDSYTQDANRAIVVYIRDAANAPVLSVGSHNFLDGDFAPELVVTQGGETGRVHATITYVVPGGILENYLRVEFSPKETRRAGQGAATMQCRLKWTGVQFTLATQSVVWLPSI